MLNMELSSVSRENLNYFNLWPDAENSKKQLIKVSLVFILNTPILIGLLGHVVHYLENNAFSFYPIAEATAGLVSATTAAYVIIVFYQRQDKIKDILDRMGDFSLFEKPEDIIKLDNILNKIQFYSKRLFYSFAFVVWLYKMSEKCNDIDQDECGLIISGYIYFINIFTPVRRKFFCTIQIVNGITWLFITYTVSWILLTGSQYIVAWLKHFKNKLVKVKDISDKQERWNYLRNCIKYHQHILKMGEDFATLIEPLFFVHTSITPVIISMILFQIVGVRLEGASVIHLSAWLGGTFGACVFGEMLIYESTSVEYIAYDCITFDGDIRTTKDLCFIIARSRKQLAIRGGKFGLCSHEQFMLIMKKAYSFLSILFSTM